MESSEHLFRCELREFQTETRNFAVGQEEQVAVAHLEPIGNTPHLQHLVLAAEPGVGAHIERLALSHVADAEGDGLQRLVRLFGIHAAHVQRDLPPDDLGFLVADAADLRHGHRRAVAGREDFRVLGIAHQQIGLDEAHAVADRQVAQAFMRDPVGQDHLEFGLDRLPALELHALGGEPGDIGHVLAVVDAHAIDQLEEVPHIVLTGIRRDQLLFGREHRDLVRLALARGGEPTRQRRRQLHDRALAGCVRIGDAAARIGRKAFGAVALVEMRRADHDGPALIAAFMQVLAQTLAVEQIGHSVAVFGKTGDSVISEVCTQGDDEVVVVQHFAFGAGTLEGQKINGAPVDVHTLDDALHEGDVIRCQRRAQLQALALGRIAVFHHVGGDVGHEQQIVLAVDQGDIDAVARVFTDFLRAGKSGEIAAEYDDMGF